MATETTPMATAPVIKLRRDVFTQVCTERGLKTTAAIAAHIRLSERQTNRIVNDGKDPSNRFIAGVLAAWPLVGFRRVFAVVDETTGEETR